MAEKKSSRFAPNCSLLCHVSKDLPVDFYPIEQRRFVNSAVYNHIINKKLIHEYRSRRNYYACADCIETIGALVSNPQKKTKTLDVVNKEEHSQNRDLDGRKNLFIII